MSDTAERRPIAHDRLQDRIRLLVVRMDLLECPEDLRLPVTRLFRGLPQLSAADAATLDEREVYAQWHRIVDETISVSGVVSNEHRLARLLDCAGTFGWVDPRDLQPRPSGPGPQR